MSVFILGATGFIGGAVASLFEQKGWKVYALARTEEKAKELKKKESIETDFHNSKNFSSYPSDCCCKRHSNLVQETLFDFNIVREPIARSADVIIEAVGDRTDRTTTPTIAAVLVKILSENKTKIVIATSGALVNNL